jgi:hypothetical protein
LALLSTVLCSGAAFAQELPEDFESGPAVAVEGNAVEETKCEIVEDAAKAGNHVMKLSWEAHSGSHVAANLATPGAILFREPGIYEITAKVNVEQCPPEIQALAIRVVDSGNETFQYTTPIVNAGEPGWTELKWRVDTNAPLPDGSKSWGERVDGAMDFPVRFLGFGAGLKDWKTDGGTLLFDDISATRVSD